MVKLLFEHVTMEQKAVLVNVMVELMSVHDYEVFKETVQKGNDDMVKVLSEHVTVEQEAALVNSIVEFIDAEDPHWDLEDTQKKRDLLERVLPIKGRPIRTR
ncbi:unnamed protein product [Sphagnum jensenii]|uniref:Uncharacterized protein n=1 Tax=Sphagnum jensenii TaxID=128206 RepID=A0ABP0VIT2_9BRYO